MTGWQAGTDYERRSGGECFFVLPDGHKVKSLEVIGDSLWCSAIKPSGETYWVEFSTLSTRQ